MNNNIVFIVLDTVRKDFFDRYASDLIQKADSSFEQCRTASSWTTPSHASMFTGVLPHIHGIHTQQQSFSELDVKDTFFFEFRDYNKIGITQHGLLTPQQGINHLFDVYKTPALPHPIIQHIKDGGPLRYLKFIKSSLSKSDDLYEAIRTIDNAIWRKWKIELAELPWPKPTDEDANILVRSAEKEVEKSSEPFFLFMNFTEAHRPYRDVYHYDSDLYSVPPSWHHGSYTNWEVKEKQEKGELDEDYARNYRDLYGASIDYLDKKVNYLVEKIQKIAESKTTFVITADHGHNLGYSYENGAYSHNSSMNESVLHVPLIIINPPTDFPQIINSHFSQLKIGELLVRLAEECGKVDDLIGEPIPSEVIGHPSGESGQRSFPGEDEEWEYWDRMIRCLYIDGDKYEWDSCGGKYKVEIKEDRPCWQNKKPYSGDIPDESDDFFSVPLQEYKAKIRTKTLDHETEERLRELGYL